MNLMSIDRQFCDFTVETPEEAIFAIYSVRSMLGIEKRGPVR